MKGAPVDRIFAADEIICVVNERWRVGKRSIIIDKEDMASIYKIDISNGRTKKGDVFTLTEESPLFSNSRRAKLSFGTVGVETCRLNSDR